MEVGIKVLAENIRTQEVRHVNSCFFTMVAVDEARKPVAVPEFKPQSEVQIRRFNDAMRRRRLRQEASGT
jgi:acyl-CoA hydrolase